MKHNGHVSTVVLKRVKYDAILLLGLAILVVLAGQPSWAQTSSSVLTGSLTVTINPLAARTAGAQWRVDNGSFHNSGEKVSGIGAGWHTVSFKSVNGWTAPATQSKYIWSFLANSMTATYAASTQTGSLKVTLLPAAAVTAGGQWQVDGGAYRNSGETVANLSTGSHTVAFKALTGYTAPASQTVSVTANTVATSTGSYVAIPQTGSAQVNLSPAGAVMAGAQWQVDGGTYRNSGETVTGLSVGSHSVAFKPVTGYTTPASQTVTVTANTVSKATGSYVAIPQTGSLKVTLLPAGAVTAGAQWQVDGGSFTASGLTVTGLSPGSHVVAFKTVTGWISPADQTATVTAGQTASLAGTYLVVPNTSHYGRFSTYEGSKTCRVCHAQETADVHGSLHYQWKGSTPYVDNMTTGGKLGAINDFCTYADISWISQLTNLAGAKVDGGCAQCHVGLGQKPIADPTPAQLDNIDCLVCHSDTYKRKVAMVGTSLAFVPAPEKMSVSLIEGITDIHLPSNGACLNCHAYAGGGNNNKRGDLEEAHRNPTNASFDVHMSPQSVGGAGLLCTDCHIVQNHHIAGRGVDLRATDLDADVSCERCHTTAPHDSSTLNSHTKRVDCTVCHIPHFAKGNSTDMLRDYSQPAVLDVVKQLYEPHIDRQANVVPEYWFFNGMSYIYEFKTPAVPNAAGYVTMAAPLGAVTDAGAKIEAFKRHEAVQAYDMDTKALLPVKAGILFQTGDVDRAIRQGATDVGLPLAKGYGFAQTERYMGLFHEVAPSDEALQCSACHNGGTRMDFDALGYTPKTTRNSRALCASCHENKSGEWSSGELFTKVHEKHVKDKKINCIECHVFAK
jgi:hypothetical protein